MTNLAHDLHGGGARTVVLLHSLAMSRSLWDPVVERLAGEATVLTVDLPGHGDSPPVTDITIEAMADAVAPLAREVTPGPAVVAGMSLGGCVAQALAVRHPALVEGLALLDTTCWYGPDAPDAWAERARRAAEDGLASLAEFQLARWFTKDFLEARPEVGRRLLDVFTANDLGSYVATCHAMGAFDYRDEVRAVSVPTLVLVGEHDPATPVPHAEDLHRRVAGSVLEIVPDSSHLSAVQRPDRVVELLRETVLRS